VSSARPAAEPHPDIEHVIRAYFMAVTVSGQAAAEALGLHPTDLHAANLIDLAGTITAGELAERTGLTTGATTRLIDRLEQAGIARRRGDPADRRRVIVEKHPAHSDEFDEVFTPVATRLGQILTRYQPDQLATLLDYFTNATTALQQATNEIHNRTQRHRTDRRTGPRGK
jgi:DNA-binding MarR family transcriptional regulator